MKLWLLLICISFSTATFSRQKEGGLYNAGFRTITFTDSGRIYKPNSSVEDRLHFRRIDLDLWYPSELKGSKPLLFKDLFKLLEQRATLYQNKKDYTGLTTELAQFFVAELGVATPSADMLLNIPTNSYRDLIPVKEKLPLIIYMTGINGMGFENYKVLETLAQNGYLVISISSIGRYPGDMTNNKLDMMEQVYDAEAAIKALQHQSGLNVELDKIGVLGCSWGGMSAAVLAARNPAIKTMVSLDGTETHYFGDDENDKYLQEIHNNNLLHPETQKLRYLYLENGDKLKDFVPTAEYNFFKRLPSNKYYLRFLHSKHEDFICIPFILNSSKTAVETYSVIMKSAVLFFNAQLKGDMKFEPYYKELSTSDFISTQAFEPEKPSLSMILLKGTVIDKTTALPLAFVNVGALNQEIGTVTNESGQFELKLTKSINDTLRISMVGYKARVLTLSELLNRRNKLVVELEPDNKALGGVLISARRLKSKNIGNKTTSRFLGTALGYNQLGAEIGVKINIRKKPTYADAFNFNISYNRLSTQALFRLNIYDIRNGKAAENILRQNINVPIKAKQTGLISVNLRPYDIVLNDDVIVALEWIKNEKEVKRGEAICFSLGLLSGGTFVKTSSQGKMKKHSNLGVGFNLDVRN